MKAKTLFLFIFSLFNFISYGQSEQCGTMRNLEEQIKKDPSLKARLIEIEKQNQEWIQKNGLGFKKHPESETNKNIGSASKTTLSTNSLCGYNNTFFTSIDAPTSLNNIISPSPNCTYGGEYVRLNNLIAGRTYRISTCGLNNFDTQITIYPAGGGNAVAFNDDWCGLQSEIYFTPISSGNYDILIDAFGCLSNTLCASLQVELWYIPRPIITIPVVVHVIHKGEPIGNGTNISVQQIQSQIDVLNQDFRRLNSNILSSPAPFRGSSADPLIQFCLAQQKPDGSPTDGIMRYLEPTQQQLASEGLPPELQCLNRFAIEYMKSITIWNRDKYLNIWVSDKLKQLPSSFFGTVNNSPENQGCNFESNLLGYAQFPGGNELLDGVWVTCSAFGTTGNVIAPYNLGRTASHEIGHWLNLKHTWGDDIDASPTQPECSLDDEVIDTPLQSASSQGCNAFPYTDSCSILFPGIMFMNHMDYSVDDCRSIFTWGQSVRMDATLFNQRVSLLTSQGCVPGTLSNNQNELNKIIIYPNPTSSKVFFDNSIEKFETATVINYLGQVVGETRFSSFEANQEVDLSSFSAGVYLVKFNNKDKSITHKIIKQ
jgi:hypothetical protein